MKLPRADAWLALGLFSGYLALLLATAGDLGFMRDEGFYFAASRAYASWFRILAETPGRAFSREVVDYYWSVNHEHPGFIKSLFAISHLSFGKTLGESSTAFRLPAMLLSSLAVTITFVWGRRELGRAAGLVAALSFAFIPPVFFHAHLACFDLPVCAMWLMTCYAYARSLEATGWGWAIASGVSYGLLLDTKHNSWLLPFALVLHFALCEARRGSAWWKRLPRAWLCMAILGPAIFYALWPWIWRDTAARLRDYVAFHTGHEYYNMEFLGRTYWEPPMPRAYAWLMTLGTVPFVTLLLALIGALEAFHTSRLSVAEHASPRSSRRSSYLLWAISIAVSYAPWLSTGTPIFGGTKHWLTAYPFLCLLGGLGFQRVLEALRAAAPRLSHAWLVAPCVVVAPIVMSLRTHPYGLSAYTPLVGGAPGAATLGLNRTFWGYTTQQLLPLINEGSPRRGTVYVHDTALQSFAMFQTDGRLRGDLRGSLDIAASNVALYHHEPHMSRVEHQIWVTYGTVAPSAIATFDGVPIAWAYLRKP
jgi:4-amino-4-deoxy-L-arabinose transferase-like glycosyltransferase